jgi:hypothetical protein
MIILKSVFGAEEIEFFGHMINSIDINSRPKNTKAMTVFPKPLSICQLQWFLRMITIYRFFKPVATKQKI